MNDSSYMATSPPSTSSPMASTSSASTSLSIGTHCHYGRLGSSSTSNDNQLTHLLNNRIDDHFLEELKTETDSIEVPNDYCYSNEEQHEFCPKMKNFRQKTHEIKRKHIFKDIAGFQYFRWFVLKFIWHYFQYILRTGERLLRRASNSDDFETVEKLLNEGIDPQSCDERNRTALHFAACKGNTQIGRHSK